jgi:predicted ATP-grasp superfamily ATP-dependent carboligase
VAPAGLAPATARRLLDAAVAVAVQYAIPGLASADFLVGPDGGFHLLEVNPRPGASLEASEGALAMPLFGLHVEACRAHLPVVLPSPVRAVATRIVYAPCDLLVPPGMRWPGWAGDRTPGGSRLCVGAPVCTVRAEGIDPAGARAQVEERAQEILARLVRLPGTRIVARSRRVPSTAGARA